MALEKGVNSYVTVAEADIYFADRLDVAAWTEADATQKEQSLITATAVIDDMVFIGVAVSSAQTLAFPRTGEFFDTKLGVSLPLSPAPRRLLVAVMETAYHLLNNDGLLDDNGSVQSLSISSINLTTLKSPSLVPAIAKRSIKPLLDKADASNTRSWWRAN